MTSVPGLTSSTLPNKVQVITWHQPDAPCALYVWWELGTRDETRHQRGMAHFLEHVLFKRSEGLGTGEAARRIESVGGDLNAWTAHDQMVLHCTVPPTAWRGALDTLATMLTRPLLLDDDVEQERGVILEEIRSYAEDPDATLSEEVAEVQWPDQPYSWRVLGLPEQVEAVTAQGLEAFHAHHLTGHRLRVVAAGPMGHEELERAVAAALGHLPEGTPRQALAGDGEAPTTPVVYRMDRAFASKTFELAWRLPDATHPDLPALELVAAILGQGAGSVLREHLKLKAPIAMGTWAVVSPGQLSSSFGLGFIPIVEDLRPLQEVRALMDDPASWITPSRLQQARRSLQADLAFTQETVDGLATELAWCASYLGSADRFLSWSHRWDGLQVTHLVQAATRWLSSDDAIVGYLDEDTEAEQVEQAWAATERAELAAPLLPPWLQVIERPGPVVSIRWASRGGDELVPVEKAGLGRVWSRMLAAGAGTRDASALGRHLDAHGISMETPCGASSVGIALSAPAESLPHLTALLRDLLTAPHLPIDHLDRIRTEMLDDVRTRSDRPEEVATLQARALRFGPRHPWGAPPGGTEASLAALGLDDVRGFHATHLDPRRMVLAVSGPVQAAEVASLLRWMGEFEAQGELTLPDPPEPASWDDPILRAGHQQAVLRMSWPTAGWKDPAMYGLDLLTGILEGQSGRLFMALREDDNLVYDVWCRHTVGLEEGTWTIGLATDPERLHEAEAAVQALLDRLVHEPVTEAEIQRSLDMLCGRRLMDQQRASWHAHHHALSRLFGLPEDPDHWPTTLRKDGPGQLPLALAYLEGGADWIVKVLPGEEA